MQATALQSIHQQKKLTMTIPNDSDDDAMDELMLSLTPTSLPQSPPPSPPPGNLRPTQGHLRPTRFEPQLSTPGSISAGLGNNPVTVVQQCIEIANNILKSDANVALIRVRFYKETTTEKLQIETNSGGFSGSFISSVVSTKHAVTIPDVLLWRLAAIQFPEREQYLRRPRCEDNESMRYGVTRWSLSDRWYGNTDSTPEEKLVNRTVNKNVSVEGSTVGIMKRLTIITGYEYRDVELMASRVMGISPQQPLSTAADTTSEESSDSNEGATCLICAKTYETLCYLQPCKHALCEQCVLASSHDTTRHIMTCIIRAVVYAGSQHLQNDMQHPQSSDLCSYIQNNMNQLLNECKNIIATDVGISDLCGSVFGNCPFCRENIHYIELEPTRANESSDYYKRISKFIQIRGDALHAHRKQSNLKEINTAYTYELLQEEIDKLTSKSTLLQSSIGRAEGRKMHAEWALYQLNNVIIPSIISDNRVSMLLSRVISTWTAELNIITSIIATTDSALREHRNNAPVIIPDGRMDTDPTNSTIFEIMGSARQAIKNCQETLRGCRAIVHSGVAGTCQCPVERRPANNHETTLSSDGYRKRRRITNIPPSLSTATASASVSPSQPLPQNGTCKAFLEYITLTEESISRCNQTVDELQVDIARLEQERRFMKAHLQSLEDRCAERRKEMRGLIHTNNGLLRSSGPVNVLNHPVTSFMGDVSNFNNMLLALQRFSLHMNKAVDVK